MADYLTQLKKLYQFSLINKKKPTLEGIQALTSALQNPQNQFKTVHVAGTNGKGSVCKKIAKGLELEGYRVGLYSSPHISTFRERISINDKLIDKESCATLLDQLFSLSIEGATFFDHVTALGFLYFANERVDYAVIETGLGGRLDSTNIINPELSVITSIDYDHCEYLGNTIEEITKEKAGIVKDNTPVIIGPTVPKNIIEETSKQLIVVDGHFSTYDEENQAIAKEALQCLGITNSEALLAKPPCRLQHIDSHRVPIYLDVAHNPSGLEATVRALRQKEKTFDILFGISQGKDLKNMVSILKKEADKLYPVSGKNSRLCPLSEITPYLSKAPHQINLQDSLKAAIGNCSSALLIVGSFFIMEEVRNELGIPQDCDPFELNESFTNLWSNNHRAKQ